jgi:S1-C subfamily serine protease
LFALLFPGEARAGGDRETRRDRVVQAVEATRHAVVPIHTTHLIERRFFDVPIGPPIQGKGVGSGVIFHPHGYVITNAHVVDRASKVLVDVYAAGAEKATLEARIFAVDVANDLAILRLPPRAVEAEPYPHLPLGRSDDLMLGETVIAVGNPFDIGLTVTTGVVAGLNRSLDLSADGRPAFADFIQTDVALNPGNSGGPLLDITGAWVGVNTVVWDRHRDRAEGIGFAIPVDRVRSLVGRAFERRLMTGEWLGLDFDAGSEGEARVRNVFPRGPAARSALQADDVVTHVNGTPTATLFDLRWELARLPVGAVVDLAATRDGRPLPSPARLPLLPVPTDTLSDEHLGLLAADVGEEDEPAASYDAGVVVRTVRPDGPAGRIGIHPGDVILALGAYQIRHMDDLLVFLQYVQPGDIVKVQVQRKTRRPGGFVVERKEGTMRAE